MTTRSVYGRWLPWLHFLDRRWVQENLALIFPTNENLRALCDCTWTTYIVLCDPYNDVFKALQPQYLRATERIGNYTVGKSHLGDPDVHLGQHLLTLYWRGIIPLPTAVGPLRQFYGNAPDKLRGSATGFIGRTLTNDTGEIPTAIIEKLQGLWETRIEAARQGGNDGSFRRNSQSLAGGLCRRDRMTTGAWTNCWRFSRSRRR